MGIPLLQPSCTEQEIQAVSEVLRSRWWGQGKVCEQVEAFLTEHYSYAHCATVNSATAALHLALRSRDIGPGDEVIVPALTFISTALAVSYVGATPVFADVQYSNLCLDLGDVRRKLTSRTAAVIAVDYAGCPALRKDHGLPVPVIQDAAHSCGAYKWAYGDDICLSFHPVKNAATGDGGALLLREPDMSRLERIKALRWCGINKSTWERTTERYGWDYDIEEVGYKCHWNDIQAAIGLVQLKRLPKMLERRAEIARIYSQELITLVDVPRYSPGHTWHLYAPRVAPEVRDCIVRHMLAAGVSVGVHYKPLTYYPMYRQLTPSVTEAEWHRLISLPIFYDMTDEQVEFVIKTLREACDESHHCCHC